MKNAFRDVERAYFDWRDGNEGSGIVSTIVRGEDSCLITLVRGDLQVELTVRPDGYVGLRLDGRDRFGYQLENLYDVAALLYSHTFPLLAQV